MDQVYQPPCVKERLICAARVQAQIIGAVILRDMRTRFGRSHLSFALALCWPLMHMMVIYFGYVLVSKVVPVGGSPGVFISTGSLPYILVLYPARMMSLAVLLNRQTLMFPIVKTTDLIIARGIVEFFSAFMVIILYATILTALEVDIVPQDWSLVASAILACIYLGIGLGVLNVIIISLVKLWLFAFIGIMALLFVTAGVSTLQIGFSEQAKAILWYNPLVHAIVWLRTAYYGDYSDFELSKTYIISVATVSMFLGIIGDRVLRGRVLMG